MILLHGLGGAKDLPVPAPLAIAGGTAALVVSFCVLALAWRQPRYDAAHQGRPLPSLLAAVLDGRPFAWLLRVLGLLFFGWSTWALVSGPDNNNNPALGVFYVLVWVGVVPASLLFGRVARAVSPVRTINLALARLRGVDPGAGLYAYPARLGQWPAAIGLFAFVWQELANPDQVALGSIRLWLAVYVAVMLIGAALFGDVWLERADPFEVYSDLLAHLSVWGRLPVQPGPNGRPGRLVVRTPLSNLDALVPRPGTVAVVAVLFGSTAYDSYKDTLRWVNFIEGLGVNSELLNTAALLGFCLVVGITFTIAARCTAVGDRIAHRALPRVFAHAVVPIIVGYMTAHYLSYFVSQGQQTLTFLSDPLVRGDDYLGTAGLSPNLWLNFHPTLLASVKVAAVVLGHVVGAVAAHDRAMRLLPARHQVTGQLGMLVVMTCYTATGLYLLFGI
ncbi:hypothetical protein [Nocardioides terrisoli]|uniref:hypothetical protein n=1 Tax=Nocardioides terrisoli TaxID=3388267 RepID=UPI00287B6143|nr:hypothetical protein [Nocardioides marmorisolisilvae]